MDFEELGNLNPDQILDLYEDILETPERELKLIADALYCYNVYTYDSAGKRVVEYTCNK